jgi:putative glycosyltransferase
MQFSVVTTLYRSEEFVRPFYERMTKVLAESSQDFEIIFVDDGSPDRALERAKEIATQDIRVTVIELSRNFGHHRAIMTGLQHARGEKVFLIDCDLEEAPEQFPEFCQVMSSGDIDVVYGVQEVRKGAWFERASGNIFYTLFNALSSDQIPPNFVTSRLMTRKYVEALLEYRERELFLGGIFAAIGFRQVPLMVQKSSRGTSSYNFRRKMALFVNSITSFSNTPLISIFYIGMLIMCIASCAAGALFVAKIVGIPFAMGWSSLVVSIWFLGGLTIFCLGIIGIYLSKIFIETKARPYTIVRKIHGRAGQ